MIVLRRVYDGVADHFKIRASEWVMLWPAFGLWFVLQLDPDMFTTSPSFAVLADWGEESTWAWFLFGCGLARLFALTINGTFRGFVFSPHIRATASLIGAAVWSQVSLGFLMAWLTAGGAPSGVIGWSTMVLLEIVNTHRSWADVGKQGLDAG
nr:hypothetical protein RKHAN_01176 [Rhizobium sp. Khangiran2]